MSRPAFAGCPARSRLAARWTDVLHAAIEETVERERAYVEGEIAAVRAALFRRGDEASEIRAAAERVERLRGALRGARA